ncbi:hypothetical protein HN51_049277 [Arachis hypogaea]|uniref:Transcription factor CBF/NF-Y/archaeal histone domain-containing protein n=1 Tax=Arachis hypogaea TaxID=3818 RepID=A0A444YFK8_ARAHY|nr:nuclear transcription factor Y subunit B-6-like [Arachis ipaensis]XP_025667362.1 nuclear transcription factor Y subunit B-6 [Arachis hypogaea]RYR00687.1 hypothetical protein Ahy_B07g088821 [Arachis hypogaea]
MRQIVPKHAKICDDTKEIVRSCVCEFIGIVTYEANGHCDTEQRRTLAAEDIIWAMSSLGFDNYAELLKAHLSHVRYIGAEAHYTDAPQRPDENVAPPPTPTRGGVGGPTSFVCRSEYDPRETGKVCGGFRLGGGAWSTSGDNVGGSEFDPLAYLNRDKFL